MTESEHIIEVYEELDRFLAEKASPTNPDYIQNPDVVTSAIKECLKQTVKNVLPHSTAFPGANDIDYSRLGLTALSDEYTINRYTRFVLQEILDKSA